MKKKISKLDIAWASGIIDGEGCIYMSRQEPRKTNKLKNTNYRLGIKVTMGHEPTIVRLRKIFKTGTKHCVNQIGMGYNLAYTWIAQAKQAREVLDKISPYCVTKADEIKVAYEFLNLPGWNKVTGKRLREAKTDKYRKREYRLWDKMRRLKPRTLLKINKDRGTK